MHKIAVILGIWLVNVPLAYSYLEADLDRDLQPKNPIAAKKCVAAQGSYLGEECLCGNKILDTTNYECEAHETSTLKMKFAQEIKRPPVDDLFPDNTKTFSNGAYQFTATHAVIISPANQQSKVCYVKVAASQANLDFKVESPSRFTQSWNLCKADGDVCEPLETCLTEIPSRKPAEVTTFHQAFLQYVNDGITQTLDEK